MFCTEKAIAELPSACMFCIENAIAKLPLHVLHARVHILHRECYRRVTPCIFCTHVFHACSARRRPSQSYPLHVLHTCFPHMFCIENAIAVTLACSASMFSLHVLNRECYRRVIPCMFCTQDFHACSATENAIAELPLACSTCMFSFARSALRMPSQFPLACFTSMSSMHVLDRQRHSSYPLQLITFS